MSEAMVVSWRFSSFDCLLVQALQGGTGYTRCGPQVWDHCMLIDSIVSSIGIWDQVWFWAGRNQGFLDVGIGGIRGDWEQRRGVWGAGGRRRRGTDRADAVYGAQAGSFN